MTDHPTDTETERGTERATEPGAERATERGTEPAPRDPVLEALWKRVVEAWDDDATHTALLGHAMRSQGLPEIAGRYRALAEDPDRGVEARKRLDGVVIAATQMLMSMKTPKPGKVPLPITLTAFALCALMLTWLAFAVWGKH